MKKKKMKSLEEASHPYFSSPHFAGIYFSPMKLDFLTLSNEDLGSNCVKHLFVALVFQKVSPFCDLEKNGLSFTELTFKEVCKIDTELFGQSVEL